MLSIKKNISTRTVYIAVFALATLFSLLFLMPSSLAYAQAIITPNPRIEVIKMANPTTASVGDVVVYTYVIINTGNVSLTNLTLVDDKLGPISLMTTTLSAELAGGGSTTMPSTTPLFPSTSATFPSIITTTASIVVTEDMGDPIVNIATVAATAPDGTQVTDSDSATVDVTMLIEPPITGSIGDTIYHDLNQNGVQDSGEMGLAGVRVTLTSPDGTMRTVETDSDGRYLFDMLAMGDYTITIDPSSLPAGKQGATNTGDPDGGPANSSAVTLSPDGIKDNLLQDFGYFLTEDPKGSVMGVLFHDLNNNGVQDESELSLAGVSVTLTDANGFMITATTGTNGEYLFSNLALGNYTITVDPTTLPDGKQDDLSLTTNVTLSEDNLNQTEDFSAFVEPPAGNIEGILYHDINGNGVQDANEPILSGVTVTLTDANGNIVGTTDTDENGKYMFIDVALGNYTVSVDPTAFPDGKQEIESLTIDVTLSEDGAISTNDLVLFQPLGSITGELVSIEGEQRIPLEGVTVILYDENGDEVARTTTNGDGIYTFMNLMLGEYTVDVDPDSLPGDKQGLPFPFTSPDEGTDHASTITLTGDAPDNAVQDFAYQLVGSIGDEVYSREKDGTQTALNGVVLILQDENGAEIDRAATNSDGQYLFENLRLGTYTVVVDMATLPEDKQNLPGFDYSLTTVLSLQNLDNREQDFAYVKPSAITLSNVTASITMSQLVVAFMVISVAGTSVVAVRRHI